MVYQVSQAERVLSGPSFCLCINTSAAKLYPIVYSTLSLPGSNWFLNVYIGCQNCEENGGLCCLGCFVQHGSKQWRPYWLPQMKCTPPWRTRSQLLLSFWEWTDMYLSDFLSARAEAVCSGQLTGQWGQREGQRQDIDLLRDALHSFTRHKVNVWVQS